MKTPNYDEQQGKHPIPHAKGVAKDEKTVGKKDDEKVADEEEE